MTEHQFTVLADLLGLSEPDRAAAHRVIIEGKAGAAEAAQIAETLRKADSAIRAAYVIHSPMEFRITVGHHDTHRAPGSLKLNVGDVVRLIAQSTERWIPVRVTALPDSPAGYYGGVITAQLVKASKFQVGNGVRFSEDQVMLEAPRTARVGRRSSYVFQYS